MNRVGKPVIQQVAETPSIPPQKQPSTPPDTATGSTRATATAQQPEKAGVSVRVSIEDGEKHPIPPTTLPGKPSAKPQAMAPVLTSIQATGTDATSKAEGKDKPKASSVAQKSNSRIVCPDRKALYGLCQSLQRGDCRATQITIGPYAPTYEDMKQCVEALCAGKNQVDELTLVVTELDENGFELLADLLKKNSHIRDLSILDSNGRAVRSWKAFADALAANRTLEALEIKFGSPYEGKEGRKQIYASLSGNRSLRKVSFVYAGMDSEASTLLAKSLRANPHLTRLRLISMQFNDGSNHPQLMEAIGSHPALEEVMLDSPLEQDDAVILMTALKTNTALKQPYLQNTPQGESAEPFTHATQDMLRHNHTLEELNISGHLMTDNDIRKLADALRDNRGLIRLWLWPSRLPFGSPLTQASVQAMTCMLDHNKVIKEIVIEFHYVEENGHWCKSDKNHYANLELRTKLAKNRAGQ